MVNASDFRKGVTFEKDGQPCLIVDFQHVKPLDCVDISTENDSFYCYPLTKTDVVTKLAFATEILYQRGQTSRKKTPLIAAPILMACIVLYAI